jgi:hypothetical protein
VQPPAKENNRQPQAKENKTTLQNQDISEDKSKVENLRKIFEPKKEEFKKKETKKVVTKKIENKAKIFEQNA